MHTYIGYVHTYMSYYLLTYTYMSYYLNLAEG